MFSSFLLYQLIKKSPFFLKKGDILNTLARLRLRPSPPNNDFFFPYVHFKTSLSKVGFYVFFL